jgi:hypothetical protein
VQVVFWGVFVPGPREVVEALWNTCSAAAVATGLTGACHRSDRCTTGSKPCKFPLCVLVCFGSEGCLLAPRSSSTPVAAWAWPTWVVSQRRVLEAVFVLLESPSTSRRIFIGSHSLSPLWFAVSVFQREDAAARREKAQEESWRVREKRASAGGEVATPKIVLATCLLRAYV